MVSLQPNSPLAHINPAPATSWWAALLVSLLLHLSLIILLPRLPLVANQVNLEEPAAITIDEFKTMNQIVEASGGSNTSTPAKTAYLSDANRQVESQQQANSRGGAQAAASQAAAAAKNRAAQDAVSSQALAMSRQNQARPSKTELQTQLPAEWVASLTPAAPSNYLPDVQMGDATLLNTREYVYAPFFIRMKQSLERVWNPQSVLKRHGQAVASEYRTALEIILNADGSLYQARIVVPSALAGLDQEALRAVSLAAPFVNPPKDLVEKNGKITIPSFYFIVTQKHGIY